MVTAIVMIQTDRDQINAVGERLAGIEGINEVYSVSGRYDLIALIRLKNNEGLAELMTEKIAGVAGIKKTESMIAFRKISKKDIAFT